MADIIPKQNSLPAERLDPALNGVMKTFRLEEEFKIFLTRNNQIPDLKPDVGFLLFLIEQQRAAIQNLTERVESLEKYYKPAVYGKAKNPDLVMGLEDVLPPKGYLGNE